MKENKMTFEEMKELINSNQILKTLLSEEKLSKYIVLDKKEEELWEDFKIEVLEIEPDILENRFHSEIRNSKTNKLISKKELNENGNEIFEAYQKKDYKKVLTFLQNQNIYSYWYLKEIELEKNIKIEDLIYIVKNIDLKKRNILQELEGVIINLKKEELTMLRKAINEKLKNIKDIKDIKNLRTENILFMPHIQEMKLNLQERNKKDFLKIFKEYKEIDKKFSIEEGYNTPLNNLFILEEEYSKFKPLEQKELDFAFYTIIESLEEQEIIKILNNNNNKLYKYSSNFDMSLIDYFDFEKFKGIKEQIFKFDYFRNIGETEEYFKNINEITNFIKYEKVVSFQNNNGFKSNKKIYDIIEIKQDYIISLLKNATKEEFKEFKKEFDVELYEMKKHINVYMTLYSIKDILKIIIEDKIISYKGILEEILEILKEKGLEESYINEIVISKVKENKYMAEYFLKNIEKFNISKTKKKNLIEYIKKEYKEKELKKLILYIEGSSLAIDKDWKKELVNKNWEINKIYNETPELFKEPFLILKELLKVNNSKIFEKKIIKFMKNSIYTKFEYIDENNKILSYKDSYMAEKTITKNIFDKELFEMFLSVEELEIEEKIEVLKRIYKKIEKQKENNDINDRFGPEEMEAISDSLNKKIKMQKWVAEYFLDLKYEYREPEKYISNYETDKTDPKYIFTKEGIEFIYEIFGFLKETDIKIKYFALNNKMIENFKYYKDKSKKEKINFIKEFEKEDINKRNKSFNNLFSWILLNGRLPKDQKLYDKIENVSEFNLNEYVKYKTEYENTIKEVSEKYYQNIIKLIKREPNGLEYYSGLSRFDGTKKYIKETYDFMDMFNEFGIYTKDVIIKTIKDTFELKGTGLSNFSKNKFAINKYINYKNFELNYKSTIDLKEFNANANLMSYIEGVEKEPKTSQNKLEELKIWLKIVDNNKEYKYMDFIKYIYSLTNDKEIALKVIYSIEGIIDTLNRRKRIDYTEIYEIFGKKIFEKDKNFIKNNVFNKMISEKYLTKESNELLKRYEVKNSADYIIKTKMVEILLGKEEFKNEELEEITDENLLKIKEEYKTKKETLLKEIEKEENLNRVYISEDTLKDRIESEGKLKEDIKKMDKKFKKENKESEEYKWIKEEYKEERKKKEKLLSLIEKKKELNELEKKIKEGNWKKEIKILTEEELKKYTYKYAKNLYLYYGEIIKTSMERKIKFDNIEEAIKQIPKDILDKINKKRENFEFIKYEGSINIEKSIAITLKNREKTAKKELLEGFELEEKTYTIKIYNSQELETYHVNRESGMLNCAAFSDIGEDVLWTIEEKPERNAFLVVKDKKTEKNIFSSYIKLLNENKEKPSELLLDNIEGNKLYKKTGREAYIKFIKEIIKSQLRLKNKTGKIKIDYITMSNQYSKLSAEEITKEASIMEEYQEITKEEYSDAKDSRIKIFDIKSFLNKHKNITEAQIDLLEITSNKKYSKNINMDKEKIKEKIRMIIKKKEGKKTKLREV